jgi:signal transduction histidine kinase
MADELALNMIIRNLIENTLRHNSQTQKITVTAVLDDWQVFVTYDDYGKKFCGPVEKLGDLFYKFDSSKGSGIGLYLIKSLMKKMRGNFIVSNDERLRFHLMFETPRGEG